MNFYYLPDGSAVGDLNGLPHNFHPEATPVEWLWFKEQLANNLAFEIERPEDPLVTVDVDEEHNDIKAIQYLNSTDWYVVRQIEAGTPIPDDIKEARTAARATINRLSPPPAS